jgi:hypothetical protein
MGQTYAKMGWCGMNGEGEGGKTLPRINTDDADQET